MNQAKKQGKEIIGLNAPAFGRLWLQNVNKRGKCDGHGYQKLDHIAVDPDPTYGGQGQGKGMADGKSGHQNQHLFPVPKKIDGTKCNNKKDVVKAIQVKNMLNAQFKIKLKLTHAKTYYKKEYLRLVILMYNLQKST